MASDMNGTNGATEDMDHWEVLAQKHWSKPVKSNKAKPNVIKKEIWDVLEDEGFFYRSLLQLESLQLLEKYAMCKNQRECFR